MMGNQSVAMQFIQPYGGKAYMIKYVYHNPLSLEQTGKKNYAVNVCNKVGIAENLKKHSIYRRSRIDPDVQGSFDTYRMNSRVPELEAICEMLIRFVLKTTKLKISKLVCNFVKDAGSQIYFLGCNHFEVEGHE